MDCSDVFEKPFFDTGYKADTLEYFKNLKDGDILKLKDPDILLANQQSYMCLFTDKMYDLCKNYKAINSYLSHVRYSSEIWIKGVYSFVGFWWSLDMFEYADISIEAELI